MSSDPDDETGDRRKPRRDRHRQRRDPPDPEPAARGSAGKGAGDGPPRNGRDPRLTIAFRELASLRSEKTIVLALLVQLFVAAFSSFLVVGLVSLYDPGSAGSLDLSVGLSGNASDEVREVVRDQEMDVRRFSTADAALDAFEDRSVDVAMRAQWTGDGQVVVEATVPRGNLRSSLIVVKTRDAMADLERGLRREYSLAGRIETEPLSVPDRTGSSPYLGFTYTVLIPLLIFLPAFISGSITVDSLTEELQRGTFELLRVAPVELETIVDAKLLSTATLAPAQAVLWLALLSFNGIAVSNWLGLMVLVAGIATTLVAAGAGIALLTPDRRRAQLLYSTGVIAAAAVAAVLPEHPANTVARLAIDSPSTVTWLSVAGYALLGVVAYVAVGAAVRRIDPEGL